MILGRGSFQRYGGEIDVTDGIHLNTKNLGFGCAPKRIEKMMVEFAYWASLKMAQAGL